MFNFPLLNIFTTCTLPTKYDRVKTFAAALRSGKVGSCFASRILEPDAHGVDVTIVASAYASSDCSGKPIFTLERLLYEGADWPLTPAIRDEIDFIVNTINTTFHR